MDWQALSFNSKSNSMTMTEYSGRQKPLSWLGFHRDGLIIVLVLDLLWTVIEIGAGASIVGIPAIPFIAFVMFGVSYLQRFSQL
ncbi:MAG: hypothetical protein WBB29_14145 [Geitlerinemataceae cyanobacterium]